MLLYSVNNNKIIIIKSLDFIEKIHSLLMKPGTLTGWMIDHRLSADSFLISHDVTEQRSADDVRRGRVAVTPGDTHLDLVHVCGIRSLPLLGACSGLSASRPPQMNADVPVCSASRSAPTPGSLGPAGPTPKHPNAAGSGSHVAPLRWRAG